ncbi:MAG: glycosyltransferase family 9 protein [Candidatus Eisenbacteria bacterium]|uniref:Glycosyltransferase family 9 protein n=1 Tax=Eiseniibacteriota bacterium TaxID=2212470 RepID=A0A849ST68_UNCEI|nr:glycosyltransferase family 9 protein [Candidatus Eisenbacteria bacterium]
MTNDSGVDPRAVRRVLMVRPRFLGDVCLTLPTLDAIRAACPQARVAYVVERESAALLDGDPRVDERIVVPRSPSLGATLSLVSQLRRFAPQVAFDFFCNPRTALWVRLSGARVRVGYPGKNWRSALYTHHVRPRTLSAVGFHLASVAQLGWPVPDETDARGRTPRLHVSEGARAQARAALRVLNIPDAARLIGFHPGARWPTRRWDPASFVALGRSALDAHADAVALVSAGPGEGESARAIVEALPHGRAFAIEGWPLARFVAMQSLCAAFVCGDTGPVHTAVAAGAPTLGLISRNRPAMFFPYPESLGHHAYYARVECSPCDRDLCDDLRCLKRLTPDGAWTILSAMLRRSEGETR